MNMSGSSAASSENTPSGQPVDTMLNKLRAYCDSKGLRHPNYEYIDTDIIGEYYVIIYLPTGQIVKGERCNGRRNALEVAAFKALKLMRSCPETPEYQGPPPTQFVPLQVTKKLTPRKAPNTDDLLGLNLGLTPPVGGPGHPNAPLGGAAPNQLLFDGQSILSAVLGVDQPSAPFQESLQPTTPSGNLVPQDPISEEQLLGDLLSESRLPLLLHTPLGGQGAIPGSQEVTLGSQQVTLGSQEAFMGLQQRGTASQQVSTEQVPGKDQNTIPPPGNGSEQSRLTPGAEEGEQGRSPVPKPGGVARTRGRRQGAKGGAKLAINFGGSG